MLHETTRHRPTVGADRAIVSVKDAARNIALERVTAGYVVTTYVTQDDVIVLVDLRDETCVSADYCGAVVEWSPEYGFLSPATSLYGSFWDAEAVWEAAADERQNAALAAFESDGN